MIKISYEKVVSGEFTMAMQKLTSTPLETKTAYAIKKLADGLQSARNKIQNEFEKQILSKYAKKDEAGKMIQPVEIVETMKADYEKDQTEFGKNVATIDRPKLSFAQLEGLKLSARDLSAIDELVSENGLDEPAAVVSLK